MVGVGEVDQFLFLVVLVVLASCFRVHREILEEKIKS